MNYKTLLALFTLACISSGDVQARYYQTYEYEDEGYDQGYDDECYEVLDEETITYRGDRGERVASGAFGGAATGALIGGIAGGGRGAGIGAGVGAGLGIIGGASSGSGRVYVTRQTCRRRDGSTFVREIQE